jgi:hypothetical protein
MNARLARSQARGLWALGGDFLGRLAIGRIMIFRPQPVSVEARAAAKCSNRADLHRLRATRIRPRPASTTLIDPRAPRW